MNKLVYFIAANAVFLLCNACTSYPKDVEDALRQAGRNASELKTVLEHYRRKDSLKYEAACFLISNMPYHGSKGEVVLPREYDAYFASADSLFQLYFGEMSAAQIKNFAFKIPDSIRNSLSQWYERLPEPVYEGGRKDIEVVSGQYLIDNIETSFRLWQSSPLLKNMSFDEFKEAILPYRTTDEPLLYKKSELQQKLLRIIHREGLEPITVPVERYKMYVLKMQRISYYTQRNRNLELYDLFLPSTDFNCHNQVNWTSNLFRACGIPIGYEFTPQWPDRENRHFWAASPDSTGVYIPYSVPMNNLKEDWAENLSKACKVYRRTYAANKEAPYFLKGKDEPIPDALSFAQLRDETYRYHQTVTLQLPFEAATNHRLAYLSLITRSGAVPVAWGKIDAGRKTVTFQQVPLSMTFVLSYYEGDSIRTVGEPFRLVPDKDLTSIPKPLTAKSNLLALSLSWNGDCLLNLATKDAERSVTFRTFTCDTTRYTNMVLTRKYPMKPHLLKLYKALKGSEIMAAASTGARFEKIATLPDVSEPAWYTIRIESRKKYKYFSLKTPQHRPMNIAELQIWGVRNVAGHNAIEQCRLKAEEKYWNAMDDDVETFVNEVDLKVALQVPSQIAEIKFIPRNANNGINKGDLYAIHYLRDGEWIEVQQKKADDFFIEFDRVPVGGLYLLRNLDNGNEELPFLLQDGKQIWISQ